MPKILIIDDERSIRNTLKEILTYEGFEVVEAQDGLEGLKAVEKAKFDVILCDIKMPKMDGIEVLEKIQEMAPETPVVIVSGHGNIDTAVEAIKKGAFDYIAKPLDLNRTLVTIRNAMDRSTLVNETKVLRKKIFKTQDIVGESEPIKQIKAMIEKVAPTEARVLVTGGNGSGKELVARWMHEKSNRAASPLVEVNCAAIPSELIESELFGHEKGSFTSAIKQRIGKFEQANNGTLFLDEIGDLPLAMQAKLLRAIQERKIRPLGSNQEESVDVRLVSATHKDLVAEVAAQHFRQDLYYRLNVIDLQLPPLRERRDDLEALCRALVTRICEETGVPAPTLSASLLAQLKALPLPGNVRELENLLHRALALSEGDVLELDTHGHESEPAGLGATDLPAPVAPASEPGSFSIPADLQSHLDAQEREILIHVLRETRFNRTAAAQRLGISLRQIRYRMERLSIDVPEHDDGKSE